MKRLITQKLLDWKDAKPRKPLLLMGVRQVGKTYILKEFALQNFDHFFYLNFEQEPGLCKIFDSSLKPKRIVEELSFHFGRPIHREKDMVIFDEIQACPLALTSLKYFQEELPELCICAAGSLLGVHLGPVSFPVGKVEMLTLHPMTFEEFLLAEDDAQSLEALNEAKTGKLIPQMAHERLWNQFKLYFIIGGMPEAVATYCKNRHDLFNALSVVREKQDQLIKAYYADMAKHSGKVNAMHIDRVFRAVPAQLEKAHDGSSGRFKFKGVVPGVSHYQRLMGAIDWLLAAGMLIKVHLVDSGLLPFKSHAQENIFKLYLFDVGLLGAMAGLSPKTILDYDYGTYKGYFAENYIAQAFVSAKEQELFSWHEKTAEVEFLQEIEGRAIPVEVKSGNVTKVKSLSVFTEKYHPPFRVILSGRPLHLDSDHGVRRYPLYLASYLNDILQKVTK